MNTPGTLSVLIYVLIRLLLELEEFSPAVEFSMKIASLVDPVEPSVTFSCSVKCVSNAVAKANK